MAEYIKALRVRWGDKRRSEKAFYDMCRPILDVSYAKWLRQRIADRDVYILVATRLFSPRTLAGVKLAQKVRDAICENTDINKWYVSRQVKEVVSLYGLCRPFASKVDETYETIMREIGGSGIGLK